MRITFYFTLPPIFFLFNIEAEQRDRFSFVGKNFVSLIHQWMCHSLGILPLFRDLWFKLPWATVLFCFVLFPLIPGFLHCLNLDKFWIQFAHPRNHSLVCLKYKECCMQRFQNTCKICLKTWPYKLATKQISSNVSGLKLQRICSLITVDLS